MAQLSNKHLPLSNFTKAELEAILEAMILLCLDGVANPKTKGFSMDKLQHVTNIERQTPVAFQERFFLLMDILEPAQNYARLFIRRKHPDIDFLFNLWLNLYNNEV
jgi:hypothetical protein